MLFRSAINWYGLVVPAKTPRSIIDQLNKSMRAVLEMPQVKDALSRSGIEAAPSSPEAFAAYIRSETKKWRPLVKSLGLK